MILVHKLNFIFEPIAVGFIENFSKLFGRKWYDFCSETLMVIEISSADLSIVRDRIFSKQQFEIILLDGNIMKHILSSLFTPSWDIHNLQNLLKLLKSLGVHWFVKHRHFSFISLLHFLLFISRFFLPCLLARVYFRPHRTSWSPNRQRLLGAILPWTWHFSER